jgi:hypothetical protein
MLWVLVGVLALPAMADAQVDDVKLKIGVAPHVSTMGIGADVAIAVHPRVNVRGGANVFPFSLDADASDVNLSISFPSPIFTLLLDFFPTGGFRFSGGLFISPNDFSGEASVDEALEIGGSLYPVGQIATLKAEIATNDLAPYFGIGIGNIAGGGAGFAFDLGLAFKGTPTVLYSATGPATSLPGFQGDLEAEAADVEDDSLIKVFGYYPVLSFGFYIGF